MLVLQVGCREAARQLGLEETTVTQWSSRYGWLRDLPRSTPLPPSMRKPVANVITPAQAMAQLMAEKAIKGRFHALVATEKALGHMADMSPAELCDKDTAQTLHTHVKSASIAGGYAANSRPDSPAAAYGGRETGLIVDAEVIEMQETDNQSVPHAETSQIDTIKQEPTEMGQ